MLKLIVLFISIILSNSIYGQTQQELNKEAMVNLKQAEHELEQVISQIIVTNKNDSTFIINFTISQKHWIEQKELDLKVKYPHISYKENGSVLPMCVSLYLLEIINERKQHLNMYLKGADEADVCRGSANFRN